MNQGGLLHIWQRRAILTVVLLVVAVAGITIAMRALPRTYQSESSVLLLASRSAAKTNGGNPYLSFSPSLTLTADVLSRELMAPGIIQDLSGHGYTASYTVALAPYTTTTTGSVLLVTVSGSKPAEVQSTLDGVTSEVATELAQLQRHVKPRNRIRTATLSSSQQPALSIAQTARSLVMVVALALLLALGVPVLVDGWLIRRDSRLALRLARDEPGLASLTADTRDIGEPPLASDDWPPAPGGSFPRQARAMGRAD
jgi:capsular polysaccharide biosynthesis protein